MSTENTGKDVLAVIAGTEEDHATVEKIASSLNLVITKLKYNDDPKQPMPLSGPVHLIVIAVPDAHEAERILLRLYRQNVKTLQGKVSTLLLCDAEQARVAYESCLEGVFDDYLIFHPLQDADQLRFAIQTGLDRNTAAAAGAAPQATSAASMQDDALQSLKAAQSDSRELSDKTETLCNTAFGKLDEQLSNLPDMLQESDLVVGGEAYRRAVEFFQRYSQKHLRPVLEEARLHLQGELEKVDNRLGSEITRLGTHHYGVRSFQKGLPKILVIDDDDGFRKTLCQQLMHEGYDVVFADTVSHGVSLMSRETPQLVLMDLRLPDYRGVEGIRLAKKLPMLAKIPIILMSGDDSQATADEAREAGAVAFLGKPIRYGVLKDTLKKYVPLEEA